MLKNYFPRKRFLLVSGCIILLFLLGFRLPYFVYIGKVAFVLFCALLLTDVILLFSLKKGITARRIAPDRLSNGDENKISIQVINHYFFPISGSALDELPAQLQERDNQIDLYAGPKQPCMLSYWIVPKVRGEYHFGKLHVLVRTPLGLSDRRYSFESERMLPVYPSFLQLKKYEIMAISDRLKEMGIKKLRKLGQNTEFEQIREYVQGDEFRAINWKATAKNQNLMVNQYQDEKSQSIYCLIDKGRAMRMPFEGMTLMDYAINASLIFSNVALNKGDKSGLITFSNRIGNIIAADRTRFQMHKILETLYNQKTRFQEPDFARLYRNIKVNVRRRSLMMLFTNFESVVAAQRQIPYLRLIAKNHLLVVVIFSNTELHQLADDEKEYDEVQFIYKQTLAEKYIHEKQLIGKELKKYGIHTIITKPQNLTVSAINKYLELKSRNLI
jgi:uncharacterized protein (DUF58 family)